MKRTPSFLSYLLVRLRLDLFSFNLLLPVSQAVLHAYSRLYYFWRDAHLRGVELFSILRKSRVVVIMADYIWSETALGHFLLNASLVDSFAQSLSFSVHFLEPGRLSWEEGLLLIG